MPGTQHSQRFAGCCGRFNVNKSQHPKDPKTSTFFNIRPRPIGAPAALIFKPHPYHFLAIFHAVRTTAPASAPFFIVHFFDPDARTEQPSGTASRTS